MKTVFIIGNGFDINIGMKTRYSDFYNYYHQIESKSAIVKNLKERIESDYSNWSDLELALGNYTENISSVDDFDEIYEDICDALAEYLEGVISIYDFNNINKKSFFHHLAFPENSLSKGDEDTIKEFKQKWKHVQWNVDIITLNYTNSIEEILGTKSISQSIGTHNVNVPIFLNTIEHIHGFLNDRMVMGVNDITQIKNRDFHEIEEILEGLVKSKCNSAQNHKIDKACIDKIKSADLICVYGSSIGDTDNFWWELIGEQLKRNTKLIIFSRGEEIKQRYGQKKIRVIREVRKRFLSKTKLSDDDITEFADNIFVGVNANLFDILIK